MTHIQGIAADLLDSSRMWGEKMLPFEAKLYAGAPRVILVAGENCTGKSFFVETLRSWARKHFELATICVSIRERSGSGTYEGASFRRAMMFGDETEHSTGATSVSAVGTAFNTLRGRSENDQKSAMLVLDEPELGLSEGYAAALGRFIARESLAMHEQSSGVVVVSHSRALANALQDELGQAPTFVKLGKPMDLASWLQAPEEHTVEELLNLRKADMDTWRAVEKVLQAK